MSRIFAALQAIRPLFRLLRMRSLPNSPPLARRGAVVARRSRRRRSVPLRTFPCQVGRHPGAGIRVVHPTVSLMHAEFRQLHETLVLADLSSRNGTFVNGNRVTQVQPLSDNDMVQFGGTMFRLQQPSTQSAQSAPANLCVTCQSEDVGDLALALAQFDKLIDDEFVVPVYQPIVEAQTSQPIAYEAWPAAGYMAWISRRSCSALRNSSAWKPSSAACCARRSSRRRA